MNENYYEVPNQVVEEKKKSGIFGGLSLILGILPWIPCVSSIANFLCISCLLATIFGIVGLCGKRKGKVMAVIGLILGVIMLVWEIVLIVPTGGLSLLS